MVDTKNYIPHIDGIRAISVLAVIFFHFHLLGFSGGYIGVDVFFTISGYLIIGSIVGQIGADRFSAASFWGRRIRRLFPAIFAVLFFSLIAGCLLMSPNDLSKLSSDSIFGLVSLINFTLLGETDYFDLQGFNEPLLHFWSLAVEEQFYLVFPLIALIVGLVAGRGKGFRTAIIWVLFALSAVSLVAAEYALRSGEPLIAYYMMPTRFFQLALGGVLAIWLQSEGFREQREKLPTFLHDVLVIGAVATILGLSLTFTKTTPFPGINAIWPTLAALALLYSGGHTHLRYALENPVSAHLGKLSYSLYLVHWPVWSFMCYYFDRLLTLPETLIALLATYLISLFIYKYVETPVRLSPIFKGKRLYAVVGPAAVAAALLFSVTVTNGGWAQRLPADQRLFAEDASEYHRINFGGREYPSGSLDKLGHPSASPQFLLIGDSKARQFAGGMDTILLERNQAALMLARDGCAFIPGMARNVNGSMDTNCPDVASEAVRTAQDTGLPIVFARSWNHATGPETQYYFIEGPRTGEPITEADMFAGHVSMIEKLKDAGGSVTLVGANRFFSNNATIAECLSRPAYLGLPCTRAFQVDAADHQVTEMEAMLEDYAQQTEQIKFIPAVTLFCPDGVCRSIGEDGRILHSDPGHLSKIGSHETSLTLLQLTGYAQNIGEDLPGRRTLVDYIEDLRVPAQAGDDEGIQAHLANVEWINYTDREIFVVIDKFWNGRNGYEQDRALILPVARHLSDIRDETLSTYVTGFAFWWGDAGVEKDYGQTVHYWGRSSQDSNATVQYRLAEILLDETLPQYDAQEGILRLRRAAEGGQEDAIARLAELQE